MILPKKWLEIFINIFVFTAVKNHNSNFADTPFDLIVEHIQRLSEWSIYSKISYSQFNYVTNQGYKVLLEPYSK